MKLKGIAYGFLVLTLAALAALAYVARANNHVIVGPQHRISPLSLAPLVDLRLAAPPTLSEPAPVSADLVSAHGQLLLRATNADTRVSLVKQLHSFAGPAPDAAIGPREPQTLDILAAAFARESDAQVKVEIVNALSDFNAPEAAEFLNRAIEDGNPAVRNAAQQAKIRRDRRLLFARCCE